MGAATEGRTTAVCPRGRVRIRHAEGTEASIAKEKSVEMVDAPKADVVSLTMHFMGVYQ